MATRTPRKRKPAAKPKQAAEVVTPPEGVEAEAAPAPAPKQAATEARMVRFTHDRMGFIDNTPHARKVYKAGEVMTAPADRWPALQKLGYRKV